MRKLQLSLKYDQVIDKYLVKFMETWVFWLKIHFALLISLTVYIYSMNCYTDNFSHLYTPYVILQKILPKSIYEIFKFGSFIFLITTTLLMSHLAYLITYFSLYLRINLKIFLKTTVNSLSRENPLTVPENGQYQKSVRRRLVFLIRKHNELLM